MTNMMVNASRSFAQDDIVADSCAIVRLKLMNLNDCAEFDTKKLWDALSVYAEFSALSTLQALCDNVLYKLTWTL